MNRTLLVVHGVANRDKAVFQASVEALAARLRSAVPGNSYRLVPAFWGDLGGQDAHLARSLPPLLGEDVRAGDEQDLFIENVFRARSELQRHAVRSQGEAAERIADAAESASATAPQGGYATRSAGDPEALRAAIVDAVAQTRFLREVRDPDVLDAIGEILGRAIGTATDDAEIATRGLGSDLRGAVGRLVGAVDDLLGKLTGDAFGAVNQAIRGALAKATALSFGDIVAYRDVENGARIRQRVLDACRQASPPIDTTKPVDVIAHSLGGLVTLEMAIAGDLRIDHFVTCGSQPAMFHLLAPLSGIDPYVNDRKSPLPAGSVARWTNLWHPMDPLAFVAGPVFTLAGGTSPRDMRVTSSLSTIVADKLWMHSAYWESDELIKAAV